MGFPFVPFMVLLAQLQNQTPPLPERAYQPHLIDPGLDGGGPSDFTTTRGDLTPDGKLFIAYRKVDDELAPGAFAYALTATIVDPERMNKNAHGHLAGFYDSLGCTSPCVYGDDFTFGGQDEWVNGIIQRGHVVVPTSSTDPAAFQAVTGDYLAPGFYKMDPNAPLPDIFGSAQFTLAMRPAPYGNPYPSNPTGGTSQVPVNPVQYYAYKIWLVRLHSYGWVGHMRANSPALQMGGAVVVPQAGFDDDSILVAQTITVVVDAAFSQIVHTSITAYEPILTPLYADTFTRGIEPTITVDGKLILYHGNGSQAGFVDGNAKVTYVYNSTPCAATGWTPPRSITQLPTVAELTAEFGATNTLQHFKDRYRLFAQPIKVAPTSDAAEYVFTSSDNVRGAYPWVSRDGSFYMAACASATDTEPVEGGGFRTRVGNYVCGDITGGFLKYVDDIGVNPTRRGGRMLWPPNTTAAVDEEPFSWRTLVFSTGIKPGPWEPLIGSGAPMPTQVASSRIPILPVINSEPDTYGEVRFEEADGNYLLYLACNESLELAAGGAAGNIDMKLEADSTPDTSGRSTRASCSLNAGAAFPQELFNSSEALRSAIGMAIGAMGRPMHENVGFKGQGILFNLEGHVDARGAPGLADRDQFTVQAFVKVLTDSLPSDQALIEYGGENGAGTKDPVVTVKVTPTGRVVVNVAVDQGSGRVVKQLQSPVYYNVDLDSDWADPSEGWMHVAVTFEGDAHNASGANISRIKMMLDGKQVNAMSWSGHSLVDAPAGTSYYLVGPGRGTASEIEMANIAFLLDEVAVSDVARTGEELYRDAYSVPTEGALGPWPDGTAVPIPAHFDRFGAVWPSGLTYSVAITDLGKRLFADPVLSPVGTNRSCATCHGPSTHFATPGQQFPTKIGGGLLPFNTPTLLNSAFGARKTFSGRADSLESQLVLPLTSGSEMGVQEMDDVLARINGSSFGTEFQNLFGGPATKANLAQALSMYMRLLHTGQSPFDGQLLYEAGTLGGGPYLTLQQQRGRGLFFGKARCSTCHRGAAFTDGDFHNIRSVKSTEQLFENGHDRGGFTGRESERGMLKTPSLRNVSATGPWFHDGSITDVLGGPSGLRLIVEHYNDPFVATSVSGAADRHLLPLGLTTSEMDDLVAFLQSLTDTLTTF